MGITVSLVAIMVAGCIEDVPPTQTRGNDSLDEAAVLAAAAAYEDSVRFAHVSGSMYPSALGTGAYIQLFADRTAAAAYMTITPDVSGSGATIPRGGIIVREVLDGTGAAQRLTIMAKGPEGYNPDIADWFWAVTDLHGTPIVEQGVARAGRLTDCYGCHLPRLYDDYLFGVALAVRGTSSGGGAAGSGSGSSTPPPNGGSAICGDFACEGSETRQSCPQDCSHGHTK